MVPFGMLILLAVAAGTFVSYVLWPTWKIAPSLLSPPEIPVTVADVLFNVPTAAVRTAVQRQPGPHERIDLAFLWPSLMPPLLAAGETGPAVEVANSATATLTHASDRLFVTITALGSVPPPAERLQSIYPQYVEEQAIAGPDGLAILPFRAGTPYNGEDLVYFATNPDQFFARCTRDLGVMPGTCIHERTIGAAEVTLRFPRGWLVDWRSVAGGFDRLLSTLRPRADDGHQRMDAR